MPYTPAMLLHFARHEALRHECYESSCQVLGDLWSSINGRPLQRFVDPTADLAGATIEDLSRPQWVRPLLREFGTAMWRGRMSWLRTRLAASAHTIVFFADSPGGVFNESFPDMMPFPAHVFLVPLQGNLAVDTPEQTLLLWPPAWAVDTTGEIALAPASAPATIPLGRAHAVRTLQGENSCWAYVFGVSRDASS